MCCKSTNKSEGKPINIISALQKSRFVQIKNLVPELLTFLKIIIILRYEKINAHIFFENLTIINIIIMLVYSTYLKKYIFALKTENKHIGYLHVLVNW